MNLTASVADTFFAADAKPRNGTAMHATAERGNRASAADRFLSLQEMTVALGDVLTLQRVAAVVADHARTATGAASATLLLRARDAQALEVAHASAARAAAPALPRSLPLSAVAPATRAVVERAPIWGDAHAMLPLNVRNRTIGVLALQYDGRQEFDHESRSFLLALAHMSALAIERSQLHELEQQMRAEADEEAARFRSLVHELDAIFWESDAAASRFTFVSRRATTILGYPLARWVEEPRFWQGIVHAEDAEWAIPFMMECARRGQDHAFEHRVLAADGRVVWLRNIVYVVRGEEGEPSMLRGVMVDITRDRRDDEGRVARVLTPVKSRTSGIIPAALRLFSWSNQGESKSDQAPHMRG